MESGKFFESKTFRVVTWTVAALVLLLLIFRAGIAVGYRKAGFAYNWGENYHRNFGGPRSDFLRDRAFMEANGAFGRLLKIEGNAIVVQGEDNVEKAVLVGDDTVIVRFRERVQLSGLKEGDYVVVLGAPNDAGQIEAKLIRILPKPPL